MTTLLSSMSLLPLFLWWWWWSLRTIERGISKRWSKSLVYDEDDEDDAELIKDETTDTLSSFVDREGELASVKEEVDELASSTHGLEAVGDMYERFLLLKRIFKSGFCLNSNSMLLLLGSSVFWFFMATRLALKVSSGIFWRATLTSCSKTWPLLSVSVFRILFLVSALMSSSWSVRFVVSFVDSNLISIFDDPEGSDADFSATDDLSQLANELPPNLAVLVSVFWTIFLKSPAENGRLGKVVDFGRGRLSVFIRLHPIIEARWLTIRRSSVWMNHRGATNPFWRGRLFLRIWKCHVGWKTSRCWLICINGWLIYIFPRKFLCYFQLSEALDWCVHSCNFGQVYVHTHKEAKNFVLMGLLNKDHQDYCVPASCIVWVWGLLLKHTQTPQYTHSHTLVTHKTFPLAHTLSAHTLSLIYKCCCPLSGSSTLKLYGLEKASLFFSRFCMAFYILVQQTQQFDSLKTLIFPKK